METNPSTFAREYRLREWAEMFRECQNRPAGVTIKEWCIDHHVTKSNYYYRLRAVRKACLYRLPAETPVQKLVAIPENLLPRDSQHATGLELTIHGVQIHVTNETSPELLKMVLEVIADVK